MREFKPLLWPRPYKRICYVPGELAFELEGFKIKVASLPRFKILGFSSGRRGLRVVNSTPDLYSTPETGALRALDLVSFNRIDDQIEQLKTTTAANSNFIRSVIRDCMERFASLSEGPSRLTPNPGQHCSLSYSPEVERPCL